MNIELFSPKALIETQHQTFRDRLTAVRNKLTNKFTIAAAIGLLALNGSEVHPVYSVGNPSAGYNFISADSSFAPDHQRSQDEILHQEESKLTAASETTAFLPGRSTVKVFFLESDGSIDRNQFDWTSDLFNRVSGEIDQGLHWWQDIANKDSRTNVSFLILKEIVQVPYEPISRPFTDLPLSISHVLTQKGIPSTPDNYMQNSRTYDDQLRQENITDWATTVYVINSGPFDTFPDGYCEYSYIGGPLMVLLGDKNCGYNNPGDLKKVMAHGVAHQFGAQDQSVDIPCSLKSGYLDIPSRNSLQQPGCDSPQGLSIMFNLDQSWTEHAVDKYAKGQMGFGPLADNNGDGVLDVAGSYQVAANEPVTDSQTILLTGVVYNPPWPPPVGWQPATINRIIGISAKNPLTGEDLPADMGDLDEVGTTKQYTVTAPVNTLMVGIKIDGYIGGSYNQIIYNRAPKVLLPLVIKQN